jgi:hypothetical protein
VAQGNSKNAESQLHTREDGRRQRIACACPKCRHPLTRVTRSGAEDGGEIIRRRICESCGHRFVTAQEPEYVIQERRLKWLRSGPVVVAPTP